MSAAGGVVILSTAPNQDEAVAIARSLTSERLVACVNVVPSVRSIYVWEGAVQDEQEVLLVIKTTPTRQDAAIARLRELHSYSVPEAIVLPIQGGNPDYLKWLSEVTQ